MAVTAVFQKISAAINKVAGILCVAMISAMVVITGLQIIFRVFFDALTWSEEACRYLLVWSTMIGSGIVYRSSGHISVTLLADLLPGVPRKALKVVVHLVCGALCAIGVFYGFKYMQLQGNQLSAAMRIPMKYMYMAIPIGCAIIDLHVVTMLLETFFEKKEVAA